jgi:hypothetical protein
MRCAHRPGARLLAAAVGHCRSRGYPRITLGRSQASTRRATHEKAGFGSEQRRGSQWGIEVDEQRFELDLG